MTLTHVVLVVLDVVEHVLYAVFDEFNRSVAFPIAAQPVLALAITASCRTTTIQRNLT